MAHGIDAAMHSVQPAVLYPPPDRGLVEPKRRELPCSHDAVLPSGQLSEWGY
jgi:hypothetical protein